MLYFAADHARKCPALLFCYISRNAVLLIVMSSLVTAVFKATVSLLASYERVVEADKLKERHIHRFSNGGPRGKSLGRVHESEAAEDRLRT